MNPNLNLFHLIVLVGAIQGFGVGFYQLLFYRKKSISGIYLSAILLSFASAIVTIVLRDILGPFKVPFIFYTLLFCPALYAYIREVLPKPNQAPTPWVHFILFFPVTGYSLWVFGMSPDVKSYEAWSLSVFPFLEALTLLQLALYYVLSFKIIKAKWESLQGKKLAWVRHWFRFLLYFYGFLLITTIWFTLKEWIDFDYGRFSINYPIQVILISIMLYSIGIWRLVVPEIVLIPSGRSRSLPFMQVDENEMTMSEVVHLMEKEKPYLNQELTLNILAEILEYTPKKLSKILNQNKQITFNDFVNQYRVQEVKRKLSDPALNHLKILALAFDSGFNSKSTFNAAFKKHLGVTLNEFRKNLTN